MALIDNGSDVLTYGVLALVGLRLVDGLRHSLRSEGRRNASEIIRGIRWRHVWPIPLVLGVVVVLATALVAIPGLSWGWWSQLGGDGNPVAGSADVTVGTIWEWLVPLVFVALLVPTLPLFALAEERMFRTGAEGWSPFKRVYKTLAFGLIHAVIGIPLGAALALSAGGGYFMSVYLRAFRGSNSTRQATFESTRAHTAYNGVILVAVVALAVSTALG